MMLALLAPPGFAIRFRNKTLAIVLGTFWVWGVLVVSAVLNQGTAPEDVRMSPGITILMGWFPGLIYSSFCVLSITVIMHFWTFLVSRR